MWTSDAIRALEHIEADARGTTRAAIIAEAIERHRRAMEAAGYAGPDGDAVEPVTQGGAK